ncbi:FAD-dependent oxidoreductase [Ligilactobacillus ceti]|uniref:CoA-disulfide reductase n=1 Tax=Ligilactobacillus ceti DSM 22408 TaxID=1122146 RepID=A0A0R2KNS5_9LACO|nr:FAD-dependent oxidoreductase [Ligilactobacillus ceti]KRN89350.1 coA-disulfide reductase [Ligilactobacillus ceti DSM 22408]
MKLVIIGGVAGGMSAAARARRLSEDWDITVYEKGKYVSFSNCGLPYHLSKTIPQEEQLILQTPAVLKKRFNIDALVEHEVTAIDPVAKTVTVKHQGESFVDTYDKLLIATGSQTNFFNLPGLKEATNVFTLTNVMDLQNVMTSIQDQDVKTAVVLGAGFIGVEVAENLAKRGIKVTLIDRNPQILSVMDLEMSYLMKQVLIKNGIDVKTASSVVEMKDQGKTVVLGDGTTLQTDLFIWAAGVRPRTELAQAAGVELGVGNGIIVDHNYETNVKDIHAVGDAIVVKHQITGNDTLIPLASPANRQGRQVADIIVGDLPHHNLGSLGTSIVGAFGHALACTGLNEKAFQDSDVPVGVVHTFGLDHAGYYPNATRISLKVIFNLETGQIYGAQAFGVNGDAVARRVDVIATAIKSGLLLPELPELELSYAPPFGVAKDIVNMAGYMGLNLMEGLTQSIQWYEIKKYLDAGWEVIDVRTAQEYQEQGHLPGSLNIPIDELRERRHELDPNKKYLLACLSGLRSYLAERQLRGQGFKELRNIDGAYLVYKNMCPELVEFD